MKNEHEVHFKGKITFAAIVEREDRILLMQDPRESKSVWELPAGRMNIDEDPGETMEREFSEELGGYIKIGAVVHMQQFFHHGENAHAFVIVYEAILANPEEDFVLDDNEVSKVGWFKQEEITELELFPEYKRALEVYFAT